MTVDILTRSESNTLALSGEWKQNISMIQTVEAIIDEQGKVKVLRDVLLPRGRRALVTVLDEKPDDGIGEAALLSEGSLSEDWLRAEEDEAWSHLELEP